MKLKLLLFGLLLSFLSDVASWTVNLSEMKIVDSDKEKPYEQKDKKDFLYDSLNKKTEYLIDKSKYAKQYEYQSYKEKKVTNAIQSGSRYLEGLSQTLLEYRQMLESCGDVNITESINKTKKSQPETKVSCNTAQKHGKTVQKLSDLALQTANKLKNKDYDTDKDGQREENELLLQLAWFLDHLARYTGYVPNINDFNTTDKSQSIEDTAVVTKNGRDSSLELLETVENGRSMSKLPPKVTADKTVVKRSVRPLTDVVKYYTKYKLWNGSNLNTSDSNFDIDNEIRVKSIKKRSIFRKKYNYLLYKNITKMSKRIPYIDKLRKHGIVKVTVVKKLKN